MDLIDGRVSDVRGIFQKDGRGQDGLTTTFMRLGAPGLDQANIARGGVALAPEDHIPRYRGLHAEIEEIGRHVIRAFEGHIGKIGEIGIDFIIGQNGQPFVLEINDKMGYASVLHLARERGGRFKQELEVFLRRPMEYALYLIQ